MPILSVWRTLEVSKDWIFDVEPKLPQPVSRNTANKDARTGCLQVRRLVLRVRFPKKNHQLWVDTVLAPFSAVLK